MEKFGNDLADAVADLGWWRQRHDAEDRRAVVRARHHWYPTVSHLRSFVDKDNDTLIEVHPTIVGGLALQA